MRLQPHRFPSAHGHLAGTRPTQELAVHLQNSVKPGDKNENAVPALTP